MTRTRTTIVGGPWPWFQRPYAIYQLVPAGISDVWERDGWYFIAFRTAFRVRGWRIYRWWRR